ncbi:MAG TPA: SusC/RagA family TonB-linked outer membrane protein [Gemmatimonadaceae bacterium]|nr:SusC/RagA family TonB-linked outer membrane protein [Gemmatimonadaceae bacterium]
MTQGRWRALTNSLAAATLLAMFAPTLGAQGTITGRVTATLTNAPLRDASVIVIGANQTAATGEDGRYTLRNVRAGTVEVQVLRVGYKAAKGTVTVPNGGSATLDIQLAVSVIQLQDVVVTATGQQRRVELGHAIATLGNVANKVEQTPINSFSDLLTAKAPGVVVLPGVMTGGAPTVRIRGLSSISLGNSPIYVVDGVRYNAGSVSIANSSVSMLNALSPEEIESVEIVKGPSAATLYGTDASNGVVVISTRKGRAGATRWTWFAEQGQVQDRNPYQNMYANWGHSPANPTLNIRCKPATMTPSTCISDSLTSYLLLRDPSKTFIKTGTRSLYGVNVSGGTDAVRFFVAGEMDNEIGPIEMPQFEIDRFTAAKVAVLEEWMHPIAQAKLNFRANLNATLSPKLDVGASMGFATTNNRFPPSGAAFEAIYYVGMQNYGFKGPGLDKSVNDSKGTPLNDYYQYTPGDIMQRYRPQIVQRTTMSFNMNWRPLSWLQNDATLGMDLLVRDNSDLCRLNNCVPQGTQRQGFVSAAKNNNRNLSFKLTSTATWNVRPWAHLKSTVGTDYINSENDAATSSGTVLPPGASQVNDAATRNGTQIWPTATKTLGFFVQEQAGFRDRLFVTLAVRSDQNSAFGTKFQSVLYPKASVSWIASDEPFFPQWSWFNQFRLRTSYGASGVQPGRTDGLVTFSAGSQNLATRGTTTGTDIPGLATSQTGNPELKPETSAEVELGFDTQLLDNRIHAEYTYYDKRANDALINTAIAPSSAASQLSPLRNIGRTRNWGHEVTVSGQVMDRRNFAWDVSVNASHNSNEVLDLGVDPTTGVPRTINPGGNTRQKAGYPINSRWFRPYTYSDANGDGIIQVSEVQVKGGSADTAFVYAGYSFPRDIVAVTHGFDLLNRKLRLNLAFDYKGGWNLQDGGNNFQCNATPFSCRENMDPTAPLEWQARHVAKFYGSSVAGATVKTDRGYYQNGQFWKFREFSASYSLPMNLLRYVRARDGSTVVFGMRNITTWSGYTGLDPEEHDQPNDIQSNFQSAGPSTYLTLRLNLKY